MTLILRRMNRHAELMGWSTGWSPDDYVVLDQDRSVGRIYKETTQSEPRWCWSINTSPYPAPPPHNGIAKSLEDAKQAFKVRYEEMKRKGVRPFS
jgi:hypothetical protein